MMNPIVPAGKVAEVVSLVAWKMKLVR